MKNTGTGKKTLTDDERRLLIFRAAELSARCENSAVASSFLTPAEQRTVFEALNGKGGADNLFFWGGYRGAERRAAIFLPAWITPEERPPLNLFSPEREAFFLRLLKTYGAEDLPDEFISPLKLCSSGYVELGHRDWLGALMALGIKRSVIGDIVRGRDGGREDFFVFSEKKSADYLTSELARAGRDAVSCIPAHMGRDFEALREYEDISFTAASPRADSIVRSLCGVSREKAAYIIESGMVEQNYFPLTEPDRRIAEGDIISVRGYGKFLIDRARDETRKGRIRILARKYI